ALYRGHRLRSRGVAAGPEAAPLLCAGIAGGAPRRPGLRHLAEGGGMKRELRTRWWVAGVCLMAGACASQSGSPDPTPAATPQAQVTATADEFFPAFLDRFPETATVFGVANARQDRLTDLSPEARTAWQAREDAWLARLQAIDTARLGSGPQLATY